MTLKDSLARYAARTEATLRRWLPAEESTPARLHAAMRYASLGGGKRIRPALVYMTGVALGARLDALDVPAGAVELIHAYSLVHDDLPAMDDDDLRRGKPTCHRAFDEATAILAGDALQTLAFEAMANDPVLDVVSERRIRMIGCLAEAAGAIGMVGGQALDMDATGGIRTVDELARMHAMKTGALIRASVRLGGLCAPEPAEATLEALDGYARAVGLAFQIRDDILDVEGETATLGKPQGSDEARDKATYTALLGLDGAKQKAREAYQEAIDHLAALDAGADPLRELAGYIVNRAS